MGNVPWSLARSTDLMFLGLVRRVRLPVRSLSGEAAAAETVRATEATRGVETARGTGTGIPWTAFGGVAAFFGAVGTILIQGSNSIKAEVKADIAASEERMKERMSASEERMKERITEVKADLKADLKERIDESEKRLEKRIAESEQRIGGVLKGIKADVRELNTALTKAQ